MGRRFAPPARNLESSSVGILPAASPRPPAMPTATTTTPAAPLRFFNRRKGVSRRADRGPIRWSSLQRRHAEQAKDQSHQRSYHYSLHQVCLPFLLSSKRDEGDPALSHLDGLVTGPFIIQ